MAIHQVKASAGSETSQSTLHKIINVIYQQKVLLMGCSDINSPMVAISVEKRAAWN
jgi:hypothetical protein